MNSFTNPEHNNYCGALACLGCGYLSQMINVKFMFQSKFFNITQIWFWLQ